MQQQVFTALTLEQIKSEISEDLFNRIIPILKELKQPAPATELLTRKQASKLLDISLPTLLDWTKTGKIIGYRIGSRVRYKRTDVLNALTKIKHC
jgi:excisionase family DNA binding protein